MERTCPNKRNRDIVLIKNVKQKYKFLRNRIKLHFLFEILMGGMESGDISRSFKAASKLSTDLDLIEKMMQICIWSNVSWIIYQINNWKCMEIKIFIILEKITFTSVFFANLFVTRPKKKFIRYIMYHDMIWYNNFYWWMRNYRQIWDQTIQRWEARRGGQRAGWNISFNLSSNFFLMWDLVSR